MAGYMLPTHESMTNICWFWGHMETGGFRASPCIRRNRGARAARGALPKP